MDYQILEWLNLVARWFHVIAAIAWVGSSFYFVWLDASLEKPPEWKTQKGIKGDLWAFHGGGVYEVAKYTLAPEQMPKTLHWFKWEAYTTWLTGSALLILLYYLKASLYLVGPDTWISDVGLAITASILFLASGVVVYEVLLRFVLKLHKRFFITCLCVFLAASCFFSTKLFSDRAAFLHVGAMIATIMAANVFLGIIPAQKKFISELNEGVQPDSERMEFAKLRSLHNNYFTLPVVFCMISNHYAFLYGHALNWLILIYILAITAYVRHYFNLKHSGKKKPSILVISAALTLLLCIAIPTIDTYLLSKADVHQDHLQSDSEPSALHTNIEEKVNQIITDRCTGCHSSTPTLMGFTAPPAGIAFDTMESIKLSNEVIATSITSRYMPLGNITNMSEEERTTILKFLEDLN